VTSNAKSQPKVIASTGRRQVGTLTSAERGQLVTAEICFSADGSYMPPMLIFPRKRMKPELLDGAPPGAWAECHPSGWMQAEIFMSWFKRFITFSRATKETRVMLLLDGHATHTKNLDLIDLARDNGVILLCFPPHCTHRMQPLDVSFMKLLSTYYADSMKSWLRSHPGRVVTQYQITGLFGKAFLKAASMETAVNGFRKTGIWPVQRDVFTEVDFLAAETTDIKIPNEQPDVEIPPEPQDPARNVLQVQQLLQAEPQVPDEQPEEQVSEADDEQSEDDAPVEMQPQPSTSTQSKPREPQPSCSASHTQTSAFDTSVEEICPVPKVTNKKARATNVRRGKTVVLTEFPYKQELQEQLSKKSKDSTWRRRMLRRRIRGSRPSTARKVKVKHQRIRAKMKMRTQNAFTAAICIPVPLKDG
jgi:hypothetical protein